MLKANNLLNLSTPIVTGGGRQLINTAVFKEMGVFNRPVMSYFSASDCCCTMSLVPVCTTMFFTVARICWILSVMSYETISVGKQYICVLYASVFLHCLQQNQAQEFEAQSLAFPVDLCFQKYFQPLPCCVQMRGYLGHLTEMQICFQVVRLVVREAQFSLLQLSTAMSY